MLFQLFVVVEKIQPEKLSEFAGLVSQAHLNDLFYMYSSRGLLGLDFKLF